MKLMSSYLINGDVLAPSVLAYFIVYVSSFIIALYFSE